jgi:hypothetical protein
MDDGKDVRMLLEERDYILESTRIVSLKSFIESIWVNWILVQGMFTPIGEFLLICGKAFV